MKKVLAVISVVIVFIAVFVQFYLLKAVAVPDQSAHQLDINELRTLVAAGKKPLSLHSLLVGNGRVPRALAIENGGWQDNIFNMYSYQIVYQDGYGIIDTVFDKATQTAQMPNGEVFAAAYTRMQNSLDGAEFIAITHEHLDHSTGIARSANFDQIREKVFLTQEQLASPGLREAGFSELQIQQLSALEYQQYHLLAPGVVLIKAPSHTPGTQMVYIQLADGNEFLLLGDIAWVTENVSIPLAHPRLTNYALGEDVAATQSWLRLLHDLSRSNPEIHQVVAHDGPQMQAYIAQGLIQSGFKMP